MTPDVNVFLINFPNSGREMVVPNEDDTYTVLINARLSHEEQLKAYEHALRHITNEDFNRLDVQEIETRAHKTREKAKEIIAQSHDSPKLINKKWLEAKLRKLRRERAKLEETMESYNQILQACSYDNDELFARAEHFYLYGNDL